MELYIKQYPYVDVKVKFGIFKKNFYRCFVQIAKNICVQCFLNIDIGTTIFSLWSLILPYWEEYLLLGLNEPFPSKSTGQKSVVIKFASINLLTIFLTLFQSTGIK